MAGLLLASSFFFLLAPPTRPGAGDLIVLRAAEVLGRLGPGEGLPTLPSLERLLGAFLAAFLRLTGLVPETSIEASSGAPGVVLRALAALAAGGCLVLAARIAARLPVAEPGPILGQRAAAELARSRSGHAGRLAAVSTVLVLGLAPLLPYGVAQLSPMLLGGWLALLLTHRLLRKPGGANLRWGLGTGLALGLLLGLTAWLWVIGPVFIGLALLQRRGTGPIAAALVTALALALALDPVRLVAPVAGGRQILTEWMRAGGWNLAGSTLGTAGLVRFLALPVEGGWGVLPAFITALVLWAGRRFVLALGWWGGVWLLLALLPAASGIRAAGPLQHVFLLYAVIAGSSAVGELLSRSGGRRIVGMGLAFVLVVGAFAARVNAGRGASGVTTEDIVAGCAAQVPRGALLLAERDLPGLAARCTVQTIPRDSRRPDRYDFAYWTPWYADFAWVLLSEVQVAQNAGREVPLHFYGQLRASGEVVARWGEMGSGWILYRIPEGREWATAPTSEELRALAPNPDLLGYLDQLGSFLARAGRRESARRLFQAGIDLAPERESFYNNLGSVYLLESEWEEAARICELGLQRNPRSAELCYNAGRAYSELGVHARAESLLRRAVGLRPDFADAHYELARTFLALDQPVLAQQALERVLALGPSAERRSAVEAVLARLSADPVGVVP